MAYCRKTQIRRKTTMKEELNYWDNGDIAFNGEVIGR